MEGKNVVANVPLRKEAKNEQGRECQIAKRKEIIIIVLGFSYPPVPTRLRMTLFIKPKIHLDKCPISNNNL